MRKQLILGILVVAVLIFSMVSISSLSVKPGDVPKGYGRPCVMVEDDDCYYAERGNARFVELQNKNTCDHWAAYEDDGIIGWIVYGEKMSNGNFDGELEVKNLEPGWYMVTLYSDDAGTGALLGQVGYYGKETKERWADIALFQTDEYGNAEIELPYTSLAWDPAHGILLAPTLPAGEYSDVTVAVKYVGGPGDQPDWSLVITGGPTNPCDGQEKNLYEMAWLDFEIWGAPQRTMVLVQKDYTDPTWPVINWPDTYVEIKYWEYGPTFDYILKGYGLPATIDYEFIYYADPWPSDEGCHITDVDSIADGTLYLEGSKELNNHLPVAADDNYPTGAKLWLVLDADWVGAGFTGSMVGWNPADYLFEYDLITYTDTDLP